MSYIYMYMYVAKTINEFLTYTESFDRYSYKTIILEMIRK